MVRRPDIFTHGNLYGRWIGVAYPSTVGYHPTPSDTLDSRLTKHSLSRLDILIVFLLYSYCILIVFLLYSYCSYMFILCHRWASSNTFAFTSDVAVGTCRSWPCTLHRRVAPALQHSCITRATVLFTRNLSSVHKAL